MSENLGTVVQVIGPVIDVSFEGGKDQIPPIYTALQVLRDNGEELILEVEQHIGEEFEGVISGVTEWGFFVELENTVEGLVRVTDLTDDFYQYYEDTYELVGEATNRRFKLGQKVRVRVEHCDRIVRTIDFVLAGEDDEK